MTQFSVNGLLMMVKKILARSQILLLSFEWRNTILHRKIETQKTGDHQKPAKPRQALTINQQKNKNL